MSAENTFNTWLEAPKSRREFIKLGATAGVSALMAHPLVSLALASGKPKRSGTLGPHGKPLAVPPVDKATLEALNNQLAAYTPQSTLEAKDYTQLATRVEGLSPKQVEKHVGLYQGYVTKLQLIQDQLLALDAAAISGANATYSTLRALETEQSFALNGVLWHEQYFDNLGAWSEGPCPMVKGFFEKAFGSWPGYLAQLKAVAKSMRGWAVTGFCLRDGRIRHYGLDAHHQGVPLGVVPLVVLDVYEHAYMIDYATDRAAYLEVFVNNIHWPAVSQRLKAAVLQYQALKG